MPAEQRRHLAPALKIDTAFSTNTDPLNRHDARGSFDRLYSMIVNITPAPYGLEDELR